MDITSRLRNLLFKRWAREKRKVEPCEPWGSGILRSVCSLPEKALLGCLCQK